MDQAQLNRFLDENGKLLKYPAKAQLKLAALTYLGEHFQAERIYTEKEVNEVIALWHTFDDICLLRRELIERNILVRKRNGSAYWLNPTCHIE